MNNDLIARLELEDLYARYAACLNGENWEQWPEFFVDDCLYEIIPRENLKAGLPLATMRFESKGMLKDRVFGVADTLVFAPYYQRHLISGILVQADDGDTIKVEANYLVIRTKRGELSDVFNCGRYDDHVVRTPDGLRFQHKRCIFDSELIPNALIFPV